jgi:hypothetical protein
MGLNAEGQAVVVKFLYRHGIERQKEACESYSRPSMGAVGRTQQMRQQRLYISAIVRYADSVSSYKAGLKFLTVECTSGH